MKVIELGELYLKKGGSVNPSSFNDEVFDYYSIPAYDTGDSIVIKGSEIGSSKKVFQPNDVLLSRIVPHIRRSWVVGKSKGYRQIGSGEWIVFRSDKIVPNYLRFYLMSNEFNYKFMKTIKGVGGSLMRADPRQVEKFKFLLPPLPQQKKIAAILDAADAYRQKTKALIAKYEELTQSLFLDMFGDPVTNPMGWEKVKFSDVATNVNSKRVPIKQADRKDMLGDYPYYGATGIVDYINDFKFNGEFLLIAEDGKNLINRKKPIAWTVNGKFWVNNHSHVVANNGVTNLTFLAFQLNRTDISQYVTGIDQFKMNKSNLNRIPISIPTLKLQNRFAERISEIEVQKNQAQNSLKKSEDLFNSLLQKAFKGELI